MQLHDAIIRMLLAEDVDTVYTLMAEDIMGLTSTMNAEWSDEIDVIETRHEQWAVSMADGYARATDGIGVCAIGRGPAIAQTGTGIGTARAKGSNVLIIVPESSTTAAEDVKDFDQQSYLDSVVGKVKSVRHEEALVPTFEDVFRRLHTENGPIAVQIPWDVMDSEIGLDESTWTGSTVGKQEWNSSKSRLTPQPSDVDEAINLYLESDATVPPVIIAGEGAVRSDAEGAIEDLAERTGAMLATTLQAQGYFSGHPFHVGFVGTFGPNLANEYLAQSDFVLAVGCSLNNHTTYDGDLLDESTVVHVDTDPGSIEQYVQVDHGIVGDARETVAAIDDALAADGINFSDKFWTNSAKRRIADTSPFDDRDFESTPGRVDPRDVIPLFDDAIPDDRLLITDGGHFINWVLDGMRVPNPDDYIWTIDFGAVGVGLPIGLGAARAVEDRTPVVFCGDSGFMMSIQEINTAVREELPAIIIVMNDDALGSEYQQLEGRGLNTDAAVVETPDIAAVAEGFGATGYTIESVADAEAVCQNLTGTPDGPVVVNCMIDRDVRHRFYDTVHEP